MLLSFFAVIVPGDASKIIRSRDLSDYVDLLHQKFQLQITFVSSNKTTEISHMMVLVQDPVVSFHHSASCVSPIS